MKHLNKTLLTLAFATVAGWAVAQSGPPAGGPGPEPIGGPRQGPGRPPLPPRGGPRWLLKDSVRKELRLTKAQVEKIRNLAPRPPADRGPDDSGLPVPPPLPNESRKAPAGPPPIPGPDPMEESLKSVLEPDQFVRFRQLRLQHEGAHAILRPDVAKELGMSDEQIERMRPEPPAPPKTGEAPQPPKPGERPDRRKDDARILASLNDAQRAKWRELIGRPFDFGDDEEELPMPDAAPPQS